MVASRTATAVSLWVFSTTFAGFWILPRKAELPGRLCSPEWDRRAWLTPWGSAEGCNIRAWFPARTSCASCGGDALARPEALRHAPLGLSTCRGRGTGSLLQPGALAEHHKGHGSNRTEHSQDTVGSLTLPVRSLLLTATLHVARSGAATSPPCHPQRSQICPRVPRMGTGSSDPQLPTACRSLNPLHAGVKQDEPHRHLQHRWCKQEQSAAPR